MKKPYMNKFQNACIKINLYLKIIYLRGTKANRKRELPSTDTLPKCRMAFGRAKAKALGWGTPSVSAM